MRTLLLIPLLFLMGSIPIPISHYLKPVWSVKRTITNPTNELNSYFGIRLSMSGDYLVIGAYQEDVTFADQGQAYVYHRTGEDWTLQATLVSPNPSASGKFASDVDMYGDYIVVGEELADVGGFTDQGRAYVYHRNGATWPLEATINNPTNQSLKNFGNAVSIYGDDIIVASFADDTPAGNAGRCYIFHRSGTTWPLQGNLPNPTGESESYFGTDVAIAGDYALVGAYTEDAPNFDQGQAYIYFRTGVTWALQATLANPTAETSSWYGAWLALDGDYALVSAYGEDNPNSNTGVAYMYHRSGTTWPLQKTIVNPSNEVNSYFGGALELKGDYAFIGSGTEDLRVADEGLLYMYKRTGVNWDIVKLFTAPGTEVNSAFPNFSSMSGDYIAIAAFLRNGVGTDEGGVYIFKRNTL